MIDLVCYCFEYSREDIEQDVLNNGRSLIMEKIMAAKQFGGCQCTTKNPRGRGCLPDVRRVLDGIDGKAGIKKSIQLPSLDVSLQPLKNHFNRNNDRLRFLALLSPTGPGGRINGARAVHESIIKKLMTVDISVAIVWIKMLAGDSEVSAEKSAGTFSDSQVGQFYDPNRHCGKAIADSIGWQGKIAWDIYLFYTQGGEWIKTPPAPVDWMHQLKETWADRDRLRTGQALVEGLETAMSKLTG